MRPWWTSLLFSLFLESNNQQQNIYFSIKLWNYLVEVNWSITDTFSTWCFIVGLQEENGVCGVKLYCRGGNSVFKCLSRILKELIVIEETYWMQTLVDLSAGCIEFLWRCDTVVNRWDLYVLTSFKWSFGGSTFHIQTVSGFLHLENKFSCNIPVLALLRKFKKGPENCLKNINYPLLAHEYQFAYIVIFAPVNSTVL